MNDLAEPTTIPTDAELVARVHAIGDILRGNSAEGERNRRVVESSIAALTDAGLFKLAVPRRYGGYETSMKTLLDVTSAVAEYDGGTSWAVSLINVCNWTTGLYPVQAQDEVWGDNPDARVAGVFAPTAEAVKVDGGYRVTGKWYYNSGSWHADWAILGFPQTDDKGEVRDYSFALIPRSELEFEDTWFVVGLRASGSNCLIAKDVFVPEHRILSATQANEGHCRNEFAPDEPLYRAAFQPVLVLVLIGPQLGLARAALDIVRSKAESRRVHGTVYERQTDSVAFQLRMAKAAMTVDTAHLHAYRSAEAIDRASRHGVYPGFEARAQVMADTAWVAEHAREAIDMLLTAHGAGSFAENNPLQRIWRDSAVAGRHAFVTPDVRYEIFGKAMLGVQDPVVPLV
ncbi:acyl-CoA dehydrogenase family protein [Streptomyces sp. NPDC056296]|uniref:acyl-CoA dehydrogenase family protein n=1 Tax=Streptomyces sp. NPDC056296 TaxID=3345775 RepID=UPI0035DF5437